MSLPSGKDYQIQDIIKSISDGEYRIPCFQRNYVWDVNKAADLVDSLLKGYPIGSVILWRTKINLSEHKKIGGYDFPARDDGRYTSYIIDGQQRLTSLFVAFKGLPANNGTDCSKMSIKLTASDDERIVYASTPNGSDADEYVLLKDLYNATAITGSYDKKRLSYYQTILQYKISVIQIDDESLSLSQVVDIFERLNLGGKRLSLFSIIAARSYIEKTETDAGFDLAKKYEALNSELKSNYGKISESTMLQTISACLIGKCNRAEILKSLRDSDIVDNYNKIEKALRAAIIHLQGENYGVKIAGLLPYECLLVPFSYFFYKNGNKLITTEQTDYLSDFFWRCVIGTRYGSSTDTNLNTDITKFDDILANKKPAQEKISFSAKYILENGKFTLGSAFIKGILCVMSLNSPLSFAPGRTITITKDSLSSPTQKQYHHFFPKRCDAITTNPANAALVDNVVNIIFMDALTNNQIDDFNPSQYMRVFEENNSQISIALESHYIEHDNFGIFEDNLPVFMEKRSEKLYQAISRFLIGFDDSKVSDDSELSMAFDENDEQSFNSIKVGNLAYSLIRKLFREGRISVEEKESMYGKAFLKDNLVGITYPVLAHNKTDNRLQSPQIRYYTKPIIVNDEEVFITHEWFESSRESLIKWYKKHYQ